MSSNQQGDEAECTDLADTEDDVEIACHAAGQLSIVMHVGPNAVSLGDRFTVENLVANFRLPNKLACSIFDDAGQKELQAIVMDTSGNVELDIGDRFGAFRLEGCSGDSCVQNVTYTVVLTNIGSSNLVVTSLIILIGDDVFDLLDNLPSAIIFPGSSSMAQVSALINACNAATYETTAIVEAEPMGGGETCEDAFCYTFTTETKAPTTPVSTPPPTPATTPAPTPIPTPVESTIPTSATEEESPAPSMEPSPRPNYSGKGKGGKGKGTRRRNW